MLRNESRWPAIGILLLFYELFATIGFTHIPPVTLAMIGFQVCLFMKNMTPFFGVWTSWPISFLCLNGRTMLERSHQGYRVFTAPLFHASDLHLYYNMVSFAWKGMRLERRYGKIGFILLLVLLSGLTGWIYVGLCSFLDKYLNEPSYMNQCAIGFSGVLFALKVLVNESDGDFGLFSVPKKMAIWAELLIIQILVPNASFICHLAGIISGVLIAQVIPTLYNVTFRAPIRFLQWYPITFFISVGLIAWEMEYIGKPWNTRVFWSSGAPLVCLNMNNVVNKMEWYRLLSGPLEHSGYLHFIFSLLFVIPKLVRLEEKLSMFKLIGVIMSSLIGTSICYILFQLLINQFTDFGAFECVQGLSGTSFSLKVLNFFMGDYTWVSIIFETIELIILLEKRTLLYHISGLVTGLLIWRYIKPEYFPGHGIRLGSGVTRTPYTRSWGYAHYTEDTFRRVIDPPSPEINGDEEDYMSSRSPTTSERSQRSPTPSPMSCRHPPPRRPPSDESCLLPPPLSSPMVLEDPCSESESSEDNTSIINGMNNYEL